MKLPDDGGRQSRRLTARSELRLNNYLAGENGECIGSDLDVFRRRIGNRLGRNWARRPRQLKRNQKLIFGLVAVHVKARLDGDV